MYIPSIIYIYSIIYIFIYIYIRTIKVYLRIIRVEMFARFLFLPARQRDVLFQAKYLLKPKFDKVQNNAAAKKMTDPHLGSSNKNCHGKTSKLLSLETDSHHIPRLEWGTPVSGTKSNQDKPSIDSVFRWSRILLKATFISRNGAQYP